MTARCRADERGSTDATRARWRAETESSDAGAGAESKSEDKWEGAGEGKLVDSWEAEEGVTVGRIEEFDGEEGEG